jgi:hypothetical protein
MELSENNENYTEDEKNEENSRFFSKFEESIIELYYIPVYIQSNLFTDDSFKFNEVVREVNEMLEAL